MHSVQSNRRLYLKRINTKRDAYKPIAPLLCQFTQMKAKQQQNLGLMGYSRGGQEGGSPGVVGAGGLWEAGEEGAGGRISKRGGSREKWEKFHNIGTIFCNGKSTWRRELLWKGAGTGSAGCRRWDVQTPLSPPHDIIIIKR